MVKENRQTGAVLVTGLILLVVMALIGLISLNGSIFELRMSLNEENRTFAVQTAQAAIDEVTDDGSGFVVTGLPGDVVACTANLSCANDALTLSSPALSGNNSVSVSRLAPELAPPPRMPGAEASARVFSATFFQAVAEHNEPGAARGRAELNQGVMVLIPNFK
jgi:hypothetical protein